MTDEKITDDMEQRIVIAARDLFIEHGFSATSMGDIAARIGVNRPAINYYFRTKERLFQAALGSIVSISFPQVVAVVLRQDLTVRERMDSLVEIYYRVFLAHPSLPFFMLREINRDLSLIVATVEHLGLTDNMVRVRDGIEAEMRSGHLRRVPLRVAFMTLLALLTVPFTARPVLERVFLADDESLPDFLAEWKPNIVETMCRLLAPDTSTFPQV